MDKIKEAGGYAAKYAYTKVPNWTVSKSALAATAYQAGYIAGAEKYEAEITRLQEALQEIRQISEGWYGEQSDAIEKLINRVLGGPQTASND